MSGRDESSSTNVATALPVAVGHTAAELTYNEMVLKFYEDLLKDNDRVCVRLGQRGEGYGLYAKRRIKGGEEIFEEAPMTSVQEITNGVRSALVCYHCLQLLRTLEGVPLPPFLEAHRSSWPIDVCSSVPCACGVVYCSEDCKQRAHNLYHKVQCNAYHKYKIFEDNAKSYTEIERYTDCVLLTGKLLCMVLQRYRESRSMPEAFHPLKHFQSVKVALDTARQQFYREALLRLRAAVLTTEELNGSDQPIATLFGLPTFLHVFGMCTTNATKIRSCPFTYFLDKLLVERKVRLLSHDEDRAALVVCAEEEWGLVGKGTGMFHLHSIVNHSCMPNAFVVSEAGKSALDHSIHVLAHNDIEEGEQICYSYFPNRRLNRVMRQVLTTASWQFSCRCDACELEMAVIERALRPVFDDGVYVERPDLSPEDLDRAWDLFSAAEDQQYEHHNLTKAIELYERSAALGHQPAEHRLGVLYLYGKPEHRLPADPELARKWLFRAARANDVNAPNTWTCVGEMFAEGKGVEADEEKALWLFLAAAQQGFAPAQFELAKYYRKMGKGSQAFEWELLAAQQHYVQAQYAVGLAYLRGDNVEKSAEQAWRWITAAAKSGYPNAQELLTTMKHETRNETHKINTIL